ncbi:hypothetical protein Sros01_37010 [Streptomyces roseochromogenus]|nr:hypothetical protein Sros01_37010 [Streptomyces roseochromogenus]
MRQTRKLSLVFLFQVAADGPEPLIVHFEPLGWDVVVDPGDHILIEWPESSTDPAFSGIFCHAPGRLTILEPYFLPGQERNWARVWNSAGDEITY